MSNEKQELTKQETQVQEANERPSTRPVFRPRTEIRENEQTITLYLEMPGVDENQVDVVFEKNLLKIIGRVEPTPVEGYSLVYSEYDEGNFERSFTITESIERDKIEARMKDGVLTVELHKSPQPQAHKVTVQQG